MYPKVTVGSRFFFFSSLREHPDKKAQILAQTVDNILNDEKNSLKLKDEEDESNIQQALNFLYSMYQKEAAIEKEYYSKKVLNNPIIKNNKKYSQMAKDCFSPEGIINYINFMALLKIIESESTGEEWDKRAAEIKNEVDIFQQEVNTWLGEDKSIDDYPNPKFIISQLFRYQNYADKRQQSAVHKALEQTKTINNAILGSTLSKNKTNLINSIRSTLLPFLLSNAGVKELTINQERGFVSEIALYLYEKIDTIRNQKTDEEIDLDKILDELLGNTSVNDNTDNTISVNLIKYSNSILNNLNLLEAQGKQMTPSTEKIRITNRGIVGLTAPIREQIHKILDIKKDASKIKIKTKKEREKYLKDLKQALKNKLNIPSTTHITTKQEIDLLNQLLITHSKMTMYDETEYRSARGLQTILQTAIPEVVGRSLGKTDVTLLDIGNIVIDYGIENQDQFKQELLSQYDTQFEKLYHEHRKQISNEVYNNKLFNQSNSFNFLAQTKAASQAQVNLANSIKQIPEGKQLTNEEAKKTLENVFIIDNSVKHSDFIFDEKGFKGGSIGSGVIEQINNICDLFDLGGISHADRNWLIFATLNCGKGLMGAHLRPSLEDYFSTVASMLLFRTGGLLADQLKEEGQQYVSTNNIHIFTLGSLYVPASYILLTTYNALQEGASLLERKKAGSRTIITNPVTEADKSSGIIKKDGTEIVVGKWYQTYKDNYSKVSINVQLLGGFLDILEQIEEIIRTSLN